ncbi:hypothetical protein HID58_060401 [Brassica napus]|uniref:Uncharacterized protein n=2 Tax=Brassica napus TaxID=3708 RepID=A0ABQ7ZWN6_BRANA|nr:hypothetical protein HID58_060401 [Brassica napus]
MATSYTLLADLRVGRCSKTAKVHLLRVWEARNINKGGELMSVDMLLIDENADREIVQRVESAKIEMYPMAVTTLLYSHGNAADIFQMYELTIQLRKWDQFSLLTFGGDIKFVILVRSTWFFSLSTPSRKRCDDVCVRPSVLNAPFQIPTGYFTKICFSDSMYLFFGLLFDSVLCRYNTFVLSMWRNIYSYRSNLPKFFLTLCLHLLNTTNKRLVSPVFLHHDSVINLLARKSRRPLLILSTVDHLGGVLFTLYRSPMTISLTGNSNIKPVNVSQALTAGLLQFLLNEKCFFEPLSICQNS